MKPVFEMLVAIEMNRYLYIGDDDLFALKHFLSGYCACAQINGIDYGENELLAFTKYVSEKLDESRTISSFKCIVEHTQTKEESFQMLFEMLHHYLDETVK